MNVPRLVTSGLAAACLLFASLLAPLAAAEDLLATPLTRGATLPPLRLPTIDGDQTVDLASFGGQKVLLIQFASW